MSTEFPLINDLNFVEASGAVSLTIDTHDIYLNIGTELYNDDLREMIKNIQYIIDIDILFDNREEKQRLYRYSK